MSKKVKFNKTAAKIREKFHDNYLKIIDKVDPIDVEVVNPEMLDFLDAEYFSKGKSINFVANHTNAHDVPSVGKGLKKHFYLVCAREGLTLVQKIGFFLNGPIWIWRKRKDSRQKAQKKIMLAQESGYSTLTFFEASWNDKENKYMNRPFNGPVVASKQTNAHIVPVVLIYENKKCYAKIGYPYVVDKNISSRQQSDDLRDIMSTMMVELLEEKTNFYPYKELIQMIGYTADNWDKLGDLKMKELLKLHNKLKTLKNELKEDFYNKVEKSWQECPGLDRDFEASCLYKDGDSPDEVFAHLDRIKDNPNAAFLFKPGITGYRK